MDASDFAEFEIPEFEISRFTVRTVILSLMKVTLTNSVELDKRCVINETNI